MPCTVDLSGLGNNPMYNLAEGEYTLDMDSVIWANGNRRAIQAQGGDISLKSPVMFNSSIIAFLSGTGLNAGGAIYMSGAHSIMALGDHAIFHSNHAYSYGFNYDTSYGGAIYMSGINSTIMTFGDHASFSDNYAYGSSDGAGGAIYMKGNNISLTIRNGASFTNNYAFVNGGAIFLDGNNTNKSSRFMAFTHDVLFSGNMTGERSLNTMTAPSPWKTALPTPFMYPEPTIFNWQPPKEGRFASMTPSPVQPTAPSPSPQPIHGRRSHRHHGHGHYRGLLLCRQFLGAAARLHCPDGCQPDPHG